ncbi:hypothetical protein [Nocardia sp. NPDC050710]|uniref:hypothetical protein n=1 Tax=Nocardia sp. NPDC050710 TaxID=3157220 RepID=UPI0033CFFC21
MTISMASRTADLGPHRVITGPGPAVDPRTFRGAGGRKMRALNRILSVEMTVFEFLGWLLLARILYASARRGAALLARVILSVSSAPTGFRDRRRSEILRRTLRFGSSWGTRS